MTRLPNVVEVEKYLAIKLAKEADQRLTWDELAYQFKTSKRVVGKALSVPASEWRALMEKRQSCQMPEVINPAIPPEWLVPRDYQASAAEASISRNTLLVLPTGLRRIAKDDYLAIRI